MGEAVKSFSFSRRIYPISPVDLYEPIEYVYLK